MSRYSNFFTSIENASEDWTENAFSAGYGTISSLARQHYNHTRSKSQDVFKYLLIFSHIKLAKKSTLA